MATWRSKSYVSVWPTSEQGCGDSSPPSACRGHRAGAPEAQKGPQLGRVTILRRDQVPGKTEAKDTGRERRPGSKEAVAVISRRPEVRAPANAPRKALSVGGGAPPRKREEWTPYVSSSPDAPAPPLARGRGRKSQGAHPPKQQKVSKGRQTSQGRSNVGPPLAQTGKKPGVELETRWYCSSPLPDEGAVPFRRKRSVGAQAGASWADDEYWENWDGWQKVIQWGDEEAGREQRSRGGQKDGSRRERRPKKK